MHVHCLQSGQTTQKRFLDEIIRKGKSFLQNLYIHIPKYFILG